VPDRCCALASATFRVSGWAAALGSVARWRAQLTTCQLVTLAPAGSMRGFSLLVASFVLGGVLSQEQPTVAFKTDLQSQQTALSANAAKPVEVVNTAAANIGVNEKIIDSAVQDVLWAGEERSGIVFLLSANSQLFRSSDGGKTWINQMPRVQALQWGMRGSDESLSTVTSMLKSPADALVVFFTGNKGMHFVTKDGGATYSPVSFTEVLGEVKLHPENSQLILAASLSQRCSDNKAGGACFKKLFASRDAGATWKFLQDYVVQFDWAHSMKNGMAEALPEEAIIYSAVEAKKGHQSFGVWDAQVDLFMTVDMFVTVSKLVERGNRFLFTDKYLAVAQVTPTGNYVSLVLSNDGAKTFREVGMPYKIAQHSYTILDTSEGTVFLHVNHNGDRARWGNVYISNAIGTNFSLSLPYNRRDENGKCDFEKLQSMEGVYVANYYDNAEELEDADQHFIAPMGQEASVTGRKKTKAVIDPVVRTVITFDKGAIWEYLNPPKLRTDGTVLRCPAKGKHCSLHLHGVTDVFGPFYSTSSAVGLLMATGCVGDRLCFREGTINTYLSRDGGHEWYEVAQGSHIYEFGDHGGLIVMAFDEKPVASILYSWNEGVTWESYDISEIPVLVDNIMIEPGATATRFLVYGTRESSNGGRIGVVFNVDFSELHTRTCVGVDVPDASESDYETWSPSAGPNQDGCLLGHQVDYVRRKRTAACFNGEDMERSHIVKNCECMETDYECDVGYARDISDRECKRDMRVEVDPASLVPFPCPPGETYQVTTGYRRVSGDTCVGGVQHPTITRYCPDTQWHQKMPPSRWLLILLGLGLLVGICSAQYATAVGRSVPRGFVAASRDCLAFSWGQAGSAAGFAVEWVRSRLTGSGWSRPSSSSRPQFGGERFERDKPTDYLKMSQDGGESAFEGPDSWGVDGEEGLADSALGIGVDDELAFEGSQQPLGGGDPLLDTTDDLLGDFGEGLNHSTGNPAQIPKLRAPRSSAAEGED
jgi:hypothetical protein